MTGPWWGKQAEMPFKGGMPETGMGWRHNYTRMENCTFNACFSAKVTGWEGFSLAGKF